MTTTAAPNKPLYKPPAPGSFERSWTNKARLEKWTLKIGYQAEHAAVLILTCKILVWDAYFIQVEVQQPTQAIDAFGSTTVWLHKARIAWMARQESKA